MVKKLEECFPPQTCAVEDFWDCANGMPVQEYKAHGPAWAMQFIVYKEQQSRAVDKEVRDEEAEEALESGQFFSGFGNLGVDEQVPALSPQLFEQPLVQALLTDVHVGLGVQSKEVGICWMDPAKAIELLQGSVEGLEDVTEAIKRMSFLGGTN